MTMRVLGKVQRLQRMQRDAKARRESLESFRSDDQQTDLAGYRDDPIGFCRELFGLQLWSGQAEFLGAIAVHDRVAERSGHKCGKTIAIAIAAWWFICTRPDARVLITAPTDRQVRRYAWREIRRLWRLAKQRGYVLPEPALAPDTGVQFDDGREMLGFATDVPENMAGFSSGELLVVVDEASGVTEPIFEAIHGNLMGGAKLVLISNPTQASGQFFDAFHRERSAWHLLHMSSEQCARENQGDQKIKGLAELETIDGFKAKWGVDDPRYQVRVAGNFPTSSTNAVIPLGLLEAAYDRIDITEPSRDLTIGVDVARFGDDQSVVRPVLGLVACPAKAVNGFDSIQVAGLVKLAILEHRRPGGRVSVRIDAGGGYGGGVADQLHAWNLEMLLGAFVEIIEVSPAERSSDSTRYERRRDELWFSIKEWLEQGGAIDREAEPPEFEEDILTPKYAFARASGAIKVESKDEIKKRIGRSPDHGDAFALAVLDLGWRSGEDDDVPLGDEFTPRWSGMDGMGY
jgi:phage terminase large subunit